MCGKVKLPSFRKYLIFNIFHYVSSVQESTIGNWIHFSVLVYFSLFLTYFFYFGVEIWSFSIICKCMWFSIPELAYVLNMKAIHIDLDVKMWKTRNKDFLFLPYTYIFLNIFSSRLNTFYGIIRYESLRYYTLLEMKGCQLSWNAIFELFS